MIQKKICLIGAFSVGKTSLIRQFVESIFTEKYLTTVGVKIDKKIVQLEKDDVQLMIWDLAGEDDYTEIKLPYLRGASGFIYVADGTRATTLTKIVDIQENIEEDFGHVPFILAINKHDLADDWEVQQNHLDHLSCKNWSIFKTSAKTGESVDELFTNLAQQMVDA